MDTGTVEPPRVTVVERRSDLVVIDFRELWAYREFLYFLVWRDVKVRYKQTVLGATWAILQPTLTMAVFTIFFGRLAGIDSEGVPYPVFSYAALLPWTFFAQGLTQSSNSLVGSAHLITKIYFPRLVVPLASVLAGVLDFALAFLMLLALMAFYGIAPSAAVREPVHDHDPECGHSFCSIHRLRTPLVPSVPRPTTR